MRFFHKFESMNYIFLAIVNGVLLKSIKKTKFTKAIKYLDRYSYVLNNIELTEPVDKYKNTIWQLWLQGDDNMPLIIKRCLQSVKKYHNDRVILLDKKNLSNYIKLPDYIEEKYKKGIITNANYSDMIRLSLLAKYGGCWVDATTFLTDKIPSDILEADFFTYKSLDSYCLCDINTLEQFIMFSNILNRTISIESPYFLCAKPKSAIINGILNLFFEYWKNENSLIDYLTIDKFFILAVLYNKDCAKEYNNMPLYHLENVLMLQSVIFEKFDVKLYENIKKLTSAHKLTYKNLHRNPYKDSFLMKILKGEID